MLCLKLEKGFWVENRLHKSLMLFALLVCFDFNILKSDAPTLATNLAAVTNGQYVVANVNPLLPTYDTPNTLTSVSFDGVVTFDQDVEFHAQSNKTLEINIGASGATVFKPFLSTAADPNKYGHLIFNAEASGTIVINVFNDLYLTGSNINDAMISSTDDPADYSNTPLNVSFKGKGSIIFKLVNGKKVVATSLIESGASQAEAAVPATNADRKPLGAAMIVAMDQSKTDVVDKGLNKVIFQRKDFPFGGDLDCEFRIGHASYLTFASPNYSGYDSSVNATYSNIPVDLAGSGTGFQSYAALAFDVSNYDKGRMIFTVERPQTSNVNTDYNKFTDGAFNLCGHYLQASSNFTASGPATSYSNSLLRTAVNFSQISGCKAFLRVNDNQAYFADIDNVGTTYYINSLNPQGGEPGVLSGGANSGKHTRRGLWVRCSNISLPSLASNPYGDKAWYNADTASNTGWGASTVQPGFVLGINGHLEVGHNTFFDYEAQSNNIPFVPDDLGMNALDTLILNQGISNPGTIFKTHNPSALLVDGLGSVIVSNAEKIKFVAHTDSSILRHAEVYLYGNAAMNIHGPLLNGGTLQAYDGFRLGGPGETLGDGRTVLDIEGPFTLRTFADDAAPLGGTNSNGGYRNGLHMGSNYSASKGIFRMSSLWRSYDDREIVNTNELTSSYVTRPLAVGSTYTRYDRASMLINDKVDFVDLSWHHDDVSRDVRPSVTTADPAVMGSERAVVLAALYGSSLNVIDMGLLRLNNTDLHCHESICVSGVRMLMRELPDIMAVSGQPEANQSSIVMYNHGHTLDTNLKGFARIFMMGSNQNKTSAGNISPYLSNCYFNIFRHSGGDPVTGANPVNVPVTLSLKTAAEVPDGVAVTERGVQMFFMGNESNVEVGWTTLQGVYKDASDTTIFPFDHLTQAQVDALSTGNKFNLRANQEAPATLQFAGDFIYLGGVGASGEPAPQIVTGVGLGRVIYMGHGSKIEITKDLTDPLIPRPYVGFSDATIAIRLAKATEPYLNTQINLPHDQMILKSSIKPYDIDLNTLTDGSTSKYLRLTALTGAGLGTAVTLAWNLIGRLPGVVPPFSTNFMSPEIYRSILETRSISRITMPVTMPTQGLLQMATGDYLDQLAVSGATLADPFLLYMTGDINGISQTRELTTEPSSILVPGEGSFARIFMDQGARVGLGTRNWNEKSIRAWNLIGKNFVSIVPNGDCMVDVNSSLVVADAQPIVPTTNFGSQYTDNSSQVIKPSHRITFFSQESKEIRVPAGFELDLSAFGKATTDKKFSQQIAIGGKVKLIFEPGSTLRFPDLTGVDVDKQPVLYMNEESELIFESVQDMDNKFVGNVADKIRWTKITDANRVKTTIKGVGQVWLNKTSKMTINDNAIVAIEADDITPHTDVTISIQREGQLNIGDANILGGSLVVGNPRFKSDGTAYTVSGAEINFAIRLNSPSAKVYMGRGAFLGFGANIIDRLEDTMNGHWKLQPLKYVKNARISLIQGTFSHNQIYDGTSSEASLIAFGPVVSGGKYTLEFGPRANNPTFKGGGNIIYVGDITTADPTVGTAVNILSTATGLSGLDSSDSGKYSIANSTPILALLDSNSITLDPSGVVGSGITFSESAFSASSGSFGVQGSARDAFRFMSFRDIVAQPTPYVALSNTNLEPRMGYVIGSQPATTPTTGNIIRTSNLLLQTGISNAEVNNVESGSLLVASKDSLGQPASTKLAE